MSSCTSSREPAQHTCPWLNQIALTIWSTVESWSTELKTTIGDLPPSSRDTIFTSWAQRAITSRPVRSDPVKATLSTPGCFTSGAPASAPVPVTMFTTPRGSATVSPTACTIAPSSSAVIGVSSDGFRTTVQPAASAGASFHAAISSG